MNPGRLVLHIGDLLVMPADLVALDMWAKASGITMKEHSMHIKQL